MKITDVGAAYDPQFVKVDTPRTDAAKHNMGSLIKPHYVVDIEVAQDLEREITRLKGEAESWEKVFDRTCEHLADAKEQLRLCNVDQFTTAAELAEAIAQRDKAVGEADAMDEFLGSASRDEKKASAIIESLVADIHITVPFRDYAEMSPKDCYELGMMDGVAALKSQINAAIDAAMKECGK